MTAWRLADAAVVLVLALAAVGCSSDESAAPGPPVAPDEWQYFREGVTSPDGKQVVFITPAGEAGGDLKVADRDGNGVRRIYPGESSCCEFLTWVSNSMVLFVDDYRVKTVQIHTRNERRLAGWSDIAVSPDNRWVAGYAFSPNAPDRIGVVPVDGGACRRPEDPKNSNSWGPYFSADSKRLIYKRSGWDPVAEEPVGRSRTVTVPLSELRPVRGGCWEGGT